VTPCAPYRSGQSPSIAASPCAGAIEFYKTSFGAEAVFPLEIQFYGDKGRRVKDPFGHTWALGQHMNDVSPEEMAKRVAKFYKNEARRVTGTTREVGIRFPLDSLDRFHIVR
jgi:PhnB protein